MIAAVALYAESHGGTTGSSEVWDLADEVFREAAVRVKHQVRALIANKDARPTRLGIKALLGTYPTLSEGIVRRTLQDYKLSDEHAIGVDKDKGKGKGRTRAAV